MNVRSRLLGESTFVSLSSPTIAIADRAKLKPQSHRIVRLLDRTIGCDLANERPIGNVSYDLQKRSHTAIGLYLLVVGHRTIGRTRGRAINTDDKIHHIVGNNTTSGSHKRSIVRSIVAPTIDRTINRDILREQSIGGATGRKVARPVLNMTIDLVATDLPLAITHDLCDQSYDLCDQSYVLSSMCPRLQHWSIAGRS